MAVRVTQGGLDFVASLDTESFDTGINKITGDLKKVQDEAGKSGEKLNQDFAKKFQSSMNEVSESSAAGRNAIGGLAESVTSLINPTSLITAGVTAAGLAIYKYATSASQAAKDQKTLSDIIDQASKEYGKSAGEIDILKDKLNNLSIPLKDRVDIGKQYNEIAAKANQIDLTQLNNLDLINSKIEAQIKLLKDRALARAAENVVSEKAENLFKLQLEFDTKFPELNSKRVETLTQNAVDAVNEAKKRLGNLVKRKVDVNELLNFADLPDSEIQKLAQKNDKFKILLDDNTKNILTAVNHQLQAIDEYKKGTKAGGGGASILQGMINQAQDDLNHTLSIASGLFTPDKIESKISPKDVDPKNDKMNTILEERKRLLQSITDLQRKASQSGLTKEQSELDKINERYDAAIKKLQDYNSKKDEFNKKNPNANIPGFTDADFAKLTAARNIELANTADKQDAAKYIQTIALKREAFDKFEEYQKQHLALKANDMYKSELDGFTTYLDYINSEIKRITALPQTVGTLNEINALEKARGKEIEVQAERARTQAIQDYKNLLDSTKNYYSEKDAINQKYDEKEKTLQKNQSLFTIGEYQVRSNALKQGRQDELKNLQDNLFYQTEAYRLMNTNVLTLSREGAKKVVSELKDILKSGFTVDSVTGLKIELTPAEKQAIQSVIDQFKDLNQQLSTFAGLSQADQKKITEYGQTAANSFHQLGDAIAKTNEGLGDTLNTLGDITQVGTDAFSALTKFGSGDIVGGISSAVSAIVGIFSIGAKARESAQKAAADLKDFNDSVITGQIDYNELLRDQARAQSNINDLTNQELETRKELLATQQQQAQADYNTLLNQIQVNGQQIINEYTKKYGGFLGIGRKTKVVQDLAGLSNADFDQLQKLSSENKLDAGTEKWFEALKKVHDELDAIGQSQADQEEAIKERVTATTSDSILDSIIQGFENGKRATADFADNFESVMKQAVLNSFKYQSLEVPLKKFYEQFANAAQSDNVLTAAEIASLKDSYNATITAAGKQFDELQKITKVNFNSTSSSDNALSGVIKGITEQTAQLLAGQFGGLRITAFDQLSVARSQLTALNQIVYNTSLIANTNEILRKIDTYGLKIK